MQHLQMANDQHAAWKDRQQQYLHAQQLKNKLTTNSGILLIQFASILSATLKSCSIFVQKYASRVYIHKCYLFPLLASLILLT